MDDLTQFKKNAGLVEAPDHDQARRIARVQTAEFNEAEKLIFMWVKSSEINVRQFSELCQASRDAV